MANSDWNANGLGMRNGHAKVTRAGTKDGASKASAEGVLEPKVASKGASKQVAKGCYAVHVKWIRVQGYTWDRQSPAGRY